MMHRIIITARIAATLGLCMPFFSYAAPELLITWKATSYVPASYAGKAMPVAGTPIDASVLLIDGNKVISLTPYDINWYAGEDRITGGKGIVSTRIIAPATGQDSFELRASVAKYNNQPLDAFTTIPVVRPKIIIRKKTGAQNGFSVIPYFWNIMNPDGIAIIWDDLGDSITARATNKKNQLEFAQATIIKK